MVNRVAVLSDIHGVLPALEAVLAEPDVRTADRIVLTGDLAAGPLPLSTLDALYELGERAVWVRGNADRALVHLARGGEMPVPDPITPWAAASLRAGDLTVLSGLPTTAVLDVAGFGSTIFCHATPRDDEEVVLIDSSLERWADVLSSVDDSIRVVVCGHTHMPYARLVNRRMVVNPGSVGMPYGSVGGHWALLGPGTTVQLRRPEFDLDAACARLVAESEYPGVAAWADYYVRSRASDVEAIRTFGPRDGRAA
jgi:predicted phosphodiesterase